MITSATRGTDIVERCCEAWNHLVDQPWNILSIGLRDWVYRL
ncbi:hypothetical protein [Methylobacterium sp. J-090]|nr:hypothetical protein [Methylobacterium sp. J-090]